MLTLFGAIGGEGWYDHTIEIKQTTIINKKNDTIFSLCSLPFVSHQRFRGGGLIWPCYVTYLAGFFCSDQFYDNVLIELIKFFTFSNSACWKIRIRRWMMLRILRSDPSSRWTTSSCNLFVNVSQKYIYWTELLGLSTLSKYLSWVTLTKRRTMSCNTGEGLKSRSEGFYVMFQ